MKEYIIDKNDSGSRLDKYILKILNNSGTGFVYKMLRKKNITLNDKKASGNEHLKPGDSIKIYLSDDTFNKFSSVKQILTTGMEVDITPWIIYEDENIMLINKPIGVLSQKSQDSDISLNELFLDYLLNRNEINLEKIKLYKPSVCNRLDRNTSGIVICAKTYVAAVEIAKALKDRTIHKYYKCIVKGSVKSDLRIEGFLTKNPETNKVSVTNEECDGSSKIITEYKSLFSSDKVSLLEVNLITGKSHQIRAHLASIGYPLIGDYKYGKREINDIYKNKYGIKSQLLHSYKLDMGNLTGSLSYLSNQIFEAKEPKVFSQILGDI